MDTMYRLLLGKVMDRMREEEPAIPERMIREDAPEVMDKFLDDMLQQWWSANRSN